MPKILEGNFGLSKSLILILVFSIQMNFSITNACVMYVLDVRITVTQKSILFATSLLQNDYQNWKRGIFVQLLVYEVKWKYKLCRPRSVIFRLNRHEKITHAVQFLFEPVRRNTEINQCFWNVTLQLLNSSS